MDWAEFTDLGALLTDERVERRLAADVAGYSCQRGGAIAPSVSEAEMDRAKRKPTSSLDAYDYFLRAQAAHFQFTKEATDQAIGLYEQAIALDRNLQRLTEDWGRR
jgi:hypothetical protein